MSHPKESQYIIPARYRRMENMHIVFWLVKDISWCMIWKELGVAMFIPTLTIAIVIAWRTRHIRAELAHNLAIAFWICANGYWMISEFFGFDEAQVWREFSGKHIALIPFLTGAAAKGHALTKGSDYVRAGLAFRLCRYRRRRAQKRRMVNIRWILKDSNGSDTLLK